MKLIHAFTLIGSTQAFWKWPRTTYKPNPMPARPYKYSLQADEYLNQRKVDNYDEAVVDGSYTINPKHDYTQVFLQKGDKLIYRHPSLDKTTDPEYIPVNRVIQPKVFLPPRGFGGSSWQNRNRYNSYSNGGYRRPQPVYKKPESVVNNNNFWGTENSEVVNASEEIPIPDQTPQEQSKELESFIESAAANCLETQTYNRLTKICDENEVPPSCGPNEVYDVDYKKCITKAFNPSSSGTFAGSFASSVQTNVRKPTYVSPSIGFNRQTPTTSPSFNKPKGPRYYDYNSYSWKNCEYGQIFNYRNRKCEVKQVRQQQASPFRWSFFGN